MLDNEPACSVTVLGLGTPPIGRNLKIDRLNDFKNQASKADARPFAYLGCHTQTDDEATASTLGQDGSSVFNLSEKPQEQAIHGVIPSMHGRRCTHARAFHGCNR